MDRESFRRGVAGLKKEIAETEKRQRRDKKIIRTPRKTKEDHARLRLEIDRCHKREYGFQTYVSEVQSAVANRKVWLTAMLVIYSTVRGKSTPYRVDKYCVLDYNVMLARARRLFDEATRAQGIEKLTAV